MPAQVVPEPLWKPLVYRKHQATSRRAWCDPATGLVVEKEPEANRAQRMRVIARAEQDIEYRIAVLRACRESFLTWVNLFGWTFLQVEHTFEGRRSLFGDHDVPFVTWPVQDDAATELIRSTGLTGDASRSVCLDKSREMGATWLSLAVITWMFLFKPKTSTLMCADYAEAVDYTGRKGEGSALSADKDTLFGKIDYMIDWLPKWMRPRISRTYMSLINMDIGARVDGSTTRDDLGRGGRRTLVFIDEAAAIRNLKAIDKSTSDTTACRWFNSTPKGAHYFSELRSSGKLDVIVLGWWDHPHKGCDGPNGEPGRYIAFDADKGEDVITGWWREKEKERRPSIQDVAENIDIDHLGAGRVVFNLGVLNRHLSLYCEPPMFRGRLVHTLDGEARAIAIRKRRVELIEFEEVEGGLNDQGKLLVWIDLVDGRPPQDRTYIVSADVSGGNGASNSIVAVRDRSTGRKVAEYADANISPDELAALMAMIGLWFGGLTGHAFLIWEANGPGNRVGRVLRNLRYPWLYQMETRTKRHIEQEESNRIGWWNSPQSKYDAAIALDAAYASGTFVNPSTAAVQEAMKWVRFENAGLGPGYLEFESAEARLTHGDRVIADMLLIVGESQARNRALPPPPIPAGTPAEDLAALLDEEELREERAW
jgi:hypothetical protein